MPKSRKIRHPTMEMVKLREPLADPDIPSIQEYMLPVDAGKKTSFFYWALVWAKAVMRFFGCL